MQASVVVRSCSTQTENQCAHDPLSERVWSFLDQHHQVLYISKLFSRVCQTEFQYDVPDDFLIYAFQAFNRLATVQRSNVLYSLAKEIETMRNDLTDSLFPVKRMPMGLLEFMVNFSLQIIAQQ